MKKIVQMIGVFLISPLLSADEALLFRLKYMEGEVVQKEIAFYGSEVDPNRSSINDVFFVRINGHDVLVSEETLERLRMLRRSFSYDQQSGGISKLEPSPITCRLRGVPVGLRLETLYLRYEDSMLVGSDQKAVYEVPINCLFKPEVEPARTKAKESARAVIEVLRTIDEYTRLLGRDE